MSRKGFDINALDRVLGDAPIVDVFSALAGYYYRLGEQLRELDQAPDFVSRRLATLFTADDCDVARDGARAVVSLLRERGEANEAESQALIATLRASIDLTKRRGQQPSPDGCDAAVAKTLEAVP